MANVKLRVNTDVVKVNVNDNGDTIDIRLSDLDFMNKINDFTQFLNKKKQELVTYSEENAEAIKGIDESVAELMDESVPLKEREKKASALLEDMEKTSKGEVSRIHKEVAEEFDATFGANACAKVFGNGEATVPKVNLYYDFLNAFIPIVTKELKKRRAKASKSVAPKRGGRK